MVNEAADEQRISRYTSPLSLVLLVLTGCGLLARVVVGRLSFGSNDIFIWQDFATMLQTMNLPELYQTVQEFNHPPLMGYLARTAYRLAEILGVGFAPLFKTPMIVADWLTAGLLWVIWRRSHGPRVASVVVLAYSWSLVAILISGFHGNTDSLAAFLCLLAAYGLATGHPLVGGLSLAAAINVKLIPVFLIPAFALYCVKRRDLVRFSGGLAIGVVPFIPVLIAVGPTFYRNAIAYNSLQDHWGVMLFLMLSDQNDALRDVALRLQEMYAFYGRYVILAAIFGIGILARSRKRWSPYELGAMSLALFLILTPGFGVQYLVYVAPLLFAISWRWATLYSLLAGMCAGLDYYSVWDGTLPVSAMVAWPMPMPAPLFGLLAWAVLIVFVARELSANGQR